MALEGVATKSLLRKTVLGKHGSQNPEKEADGNRARELLSFSIAALTHMEDPDG